MKNLYRTLGGVILSIEYRGKFKFKRLIGKGMSKLDIAEAQINSSIEMLFKNMNPISIHTIASSAHQIVRDLAKKQNIKEYLMIEDNIRKEHLSEYWGYVNKAWIFFKHADRDSAITFDGMDELINDFTILMALRLYRSLGGKLSPQMNSFSAWFLLVWPELLNEDKGCEFIKQTYKECNVGSFTREEVLLMGKQSLDKIMNKNI